MTAKQNKDAFITHYLEDWIPELIAKETIERLNNVIEDYCREQRGICANEANGTFSNYWVEKLRNAKMPEL